MMLVLEFIDDIMFVHSVLCETKINQVVFWVSKINFHILSESLGKVWGKWINIPSTLLLISLWNLV